MPNVYDAVWVLLLKSINNESYTITEVMKLQSTIASIVSTNSLQRTTQLYTLLNDSFSGLFKQLLPTFQKLPPQNIFSSFLQLVDSLEPMHRLLNTLFISISNQIKSLRMRSFNTYPTAAGVYFNALRKNLYLPLIDILEENVSQRMLYIWSDYVENTKHVLDHLSKYYQIVWKMCLAGSFESEENYKDQEINRYISTLFKHYSQSNDSIVLFEEIFHSTIHKDLLNEVQHLVYSKLYPKKNLATNTSLFIDYFFTKPITSTLIFNSFKVLGSESELRVALRDHFQTKLKAQEKDFIGTYESLKKHINTHYIKNEEIMSDLKSSANILLSKGFGVKALSTSIIAHADNDVLYELYMLTELRDYLHRSILSSIGASLVEGKTIPQSFFAKLTTATSTSLLYHARKMISDANESKELSKRFMNSSVYSQLHSQINVNVLIATNHVWPLTFSHVNPINEIRPIVVLFVGFYHSRNPKRVIHFLHQHTIFQIQFETCSGVHTLNHYQAAALLLANQGKLTKEELSKYTGNKDESNASKRDDSNAIKAKIVRVMKKVKKASKQQIISLTQSDEFKIDDQSIQPYLDELASKEYLEFSSTDNVYEYIP
ncbi:Cullin family profile domain-containing protein [Entamoeba marina]